MAERTLVETEWGDKVALDTSGGGFYLIVTHGEDDPVSLSVTLRPVDAVTIARELLKAYWL